MTRNRHCRWAEKDERSRPWEAEDSRYDVGDCHTKQQAKRMESQPCNSTSNLILDLGDGPGEEDPWGF
jgi:hypothetical protein